MAVTRGQRIGIWVIAVFMAVGTIGSFAIIVLANANAQNDQKRYNELAAQYQADDDAFNKKLSDTYFPKLKEYESRVAPFDEASVTELTTVDLAEGTGETLTSESTFTAFYIGWNPAGTVFDSSFNDTKDGLKTPFNTAAGVISGWPMGVDGMKEGGVRELALPSDLAYGEQGNGENIGPNMPLKFIVLVVPSGEVNSAPQPTEELINLQKRIYGY